MKNDKEQAKTLLAGLPAHLIQNLPVRVLTIDGRLEVLSVYRALGVLTVDVEQPPTPAPAWNGPEDGLPPVGLEVEVLWSGACGNYVRAKVVAHDEGCAVFRFLEGVREGEYQAERNATYNGGALTNFRPVRTAEQLAAEERLHQIRNACTAVNSKVEEFNTNLECSLAIRSTIEAMYDAGYRKVEVSK